METISDFSTGALNEFHNLLRVEVPTGLGLISISMRASQRRVWPHLSQDRPHGRFSSHSLTSSNSSYSATALSVGRTSERNNPLTSFAENGHLFSTHQLSTRIYCTRRSGGIWPPALSRPRKLFLTSSAISPERTFWSCPCRTVRPLGPSLSSPAWRS